MKIKSNFILIILIILFISIRNNIATKQQIAENINKIIYGEWYNKSAVALGDSITYGQGSSIGGYVGVVKDKIRLKEYLNKGVSGRPMANGTVNGDGTNITGKTVDYKNYDLVTISAGTNDFKLNVNLGAQDTMKNTNTFYGAYRDLIEYILNQNPSIKIVLLTPIQRDNDGYDINTANTAGYKLYDYVFVIKNLGKMYNLPVCDMYSNSGINISNLSTLTQDGLHPNDEGYTRMGNYLANYLKST